MDEKLFISLVSVAVGWILGQGTALAKDWWNARKLCGGLLVEIQDIDEQLRRVIMGHARSLQIYALNAIEYDATLPIQNMFFRQYFKDAFSNLNREQRISYQLIHASLDVLNTKMEELGQYVDDVFKENNKDQQKRRESIEYWGGKVTAIYHIAMTIRWHIEYHLKHPKRPAFDLLGPMHESYVKFEQWLEDDIKEIIENAKKLTLDDFKKIYDEKHFEKPRATS